MTAPLPRLRESTITFANGSIGRNFDIPSATPANYFEAISRPAAMARVTVDGKLFLPPGASDSKPLPLVIVVPGSLGVAASHLAHAETLTEIGIAAFVLDPFGARGVGSTVGARPPPQGPRSHGLWAQVGLRRKGRNDWYAR